LSKNGGDMWYPDRVHGAVIRETHSEMRRWVHAKYGQRTSALLAIVQDRRAKHSSIL